MSIAFNSCTFAGYLTKDPVLDSHPKCKFSLAVNGYKEGEVYFQDCVAWKDLANSIGTYMSKGSAILVQGEMREDKWQHEGKEYRRHVLTVFKAQFLDKKPFTEKPDEDLPF